ncbi:hypothetical protein KGQ71_03235 [Patescibacteria group bacterium]|nr:hypothetical protein [Patescibacteria group bacterium]
MNLFFWRKKNGSTADLLARGEETAAFFTAKLKEYSDEKEQLLRRQVELWQIFNLSPDLESEYRQVSSRISLLANKILSTEKYLEKLKLGLYLYKEQNKPDTLRDYLAMRGSFEQIAAFSTIS